MQNQDNDNDNINWEMLRRWRERWQNGPFAKDLPESAQAPEQQIKEIEKGLNELKPGLISYMLLPHSNGLATVTIVTVVDPQKIDAQRLATFVANYVEACPQQNQPPQAQAQEVVFDGDEYSVMKGKIEELWAVEQTRQKHLAHIVEYALSQSGNEKEGPFTWWQYPLIWAQKGLQKLVSDLDWLIELGE